MAKNYGKNALNALNFSICDIEPLTKSQLLAFDSEKHMILHGCAGTGKTFISFYIAFDDIIKGLYSNILVIRSAVPTRDIGYLPGNEEEKTRIYEEPYKDITKELFQRGDAYKTLREKGLIDFMTTSYIRGLTFNNSVIIVDECQNMSFHELDSIITRVGHNCRIIFCGDFFQSDLKQNGLKSFLQITKAMNEFDFIEFGISDIVRSDFVRNYLTCKHSIEGFSP